MDTFEQHLERQASRGLRLGIYMQHRDRGLHHPVGPLISHNVYDAQSSPYWCKTHGHVPLIPLKEHSTYLAAISFPQHRLIMVEAVDKDYVQVDKLVKCRTAYFFLYSLDGTWEEVTDDMLGLIQLMLDE